MARRRSRENGFHLKTSRRTNQNILLKTGVCWANQNIYIAPRGVKTTWFSRWQTAFFVTVLGLIKI